MYIFLIKTTFRPSGELIASSQIEGQNKRIIFFERNGLRHGEFLLREKECEILDILWNTDSDILAIPLRINVHFIVICSHLPTHRKCHCLYILLRRETTLFNCGQQKIIIGI
jgi:hypothetical protein